MENKYYTPSIEEFFVGFEYEEEDSLEDNLWIKRTLDFNYGWLEIPQDFANNKRVKYLDASDIEELGFDRLNDLSGYVQMYKKDVWYIIWQPESIKHGKGSLVVEDINDVCLFRGFIKNKSELKKILNMLNIK